MMSSSVSRKLKSLLITKKSMPTTSMRLKAQFINVSSGSYKLLLKFNSEILPNECVVSTEVEYASHVLPFKLFSQTIQPQRGIMLQEFNIQIAPKVIVYITGGDELMDCAQSISVEMVHHNRTMIELIENNSYSINDFADPDKQHKVCGIGTAGSEYFELRNVYGKPMVYLKTVCSLQLEAYFANVPNGEYFVFWKVFLGNGSAWTWALDHAWIEVAENVEGSRKVKATNEHLQYDRDLRDFQLIQGPDVVLTDVRNGFSDFEVTLKSFIVGGSGWKNDVYFASVILIHKDKLVTQASTLKDIAYKSLLSNEPTIDDIEIAMHLSLPIRNIANFIQCNEDQIYDDTNHVDPTDNDHNSVPYHPWLPYDSANGLIYGDNIPWYS